MLRILLALVVAFGTVPPAMADRGVLPDLAPLSAVESLSAIARLRGAHRTSGGCSAVLIAADVALTAAHCAYGAVSGPTAMRMVFRPDRNPPLFSVTVRAVAFHEDHVRGRIRARNAHADLALLRLAQPVPPEVATPIPLADDKMSDLVSIYGYRNGLSDDLRGHPGCALFQLAPSLLGSDCTVVSGFSGTAVLSGGPGDWRLEGIAVATVGNDRVRAFIADVVPWPKFAGVYSLDAPPDGSAPLPGGPVPGE